MKQDKIRDQLLRLHNVISETSLTCEEIVENRKLAHDLSLLHHAELSGKVASGSRVSVEKYDTLGDKFDYGTTIESR